MVRKTVQLFVLAACLHVYSAALIELKDFPEDVLRQIAKNLSPEAKVKFASTLRAAKETVDPHPIKAPVDTVNRSDQTYVGFAREVLYDIIYGLGLMTMPDVPVLDHSVPSTELKDLPEVLVGEIAKKIPTLGRVRFASTSKAVRGAVDLRSTKILIDTVNRLERQYAKYAFKAFYHIPYQLGLMTVPDVSADDGYLVKSSKHLFAGNDRYAGISAVDRYATYGRVFVNVHLDDLMSATAKSAKINPHAEMSFIHDGSVELAYIRINVYANFHKYSTPSVIECVNNAHARIKKECIDGVMSTRKRIHAPESVKEYNRDLMAQRCAVYSFMCGISYYID